MLYFNCVILLQLVSFFLEITLLIVNGVNYPIQSEWADLGRFKTSNKSLENRIKKSIEFYPCEVLFIHRDAEKEPHQNRINEIKKALENAKISIPHICVIPVRMSEAWLLFDENAIRKGAENPNGKQTLKLPKLNQIENIPNPKSLLCDLLRQASGLTGRRLEKFAAKERQKIINISNYIKDFSPLRELAAFQSLEQEIKTVLQENNWIN